MQLAQFATEGRYDLLHISMITNLNTLCEKGQAIAVNMTQLERPSKRGWTSILKQLAISVVKCNETFTYQIFGDSDVSSVPRLSPFAA